MFDIYEELKGLIPVKICQKYRKDEYFTIVTNYSNEYLYLNETASFVFLNCDGKNNIDSIFKLIFDEYEADYQIIKNDLIRIIRDLQWKGIIKLRQHQTSQTAAKK